MKRLIISMMGVVCLVRLLFSPAFGQRLRPLVRNGAQSVEWFRGAKQIDSIEFFPLKTAHYVAKDIKGNSYDFESILSSGKHILIDVSAVWCGPCWNIHKSKLLEKIQDKYKEDLLVLWVDNEGNPLDVLQGGGNSNGDWTDGGNCPTPIISDANLTATLGLPVPYYPSFFFIDLDRSYGSCFEHITIHKMAGIDYLMEHSLHLDSKPTLSKISSEGGVVNSDVILFSNTRSVDANAVYSWSIEGATPSTSSEKTPKVRWDKPGIYQVSLTVKDRNGEVSYSTNIGINSESLVSYFPYKEGFNSKPVGWTSIDIDKDGYNWMSLNDMYVKVYKDMWKPEYTADEAHSGMDCYASFSNYLESIDESGNPSFKKLNTKQMLVTPAIQLPKDKVVHLKFYTHNLEPNNTDQLSVVISESGNGENDFTEVLLPAKVYEVDMDKIWNEVNASLEKYAGKKIYIGFLHEGNGAIGVYLDDVSLIQGELLSVDAPRGDNSMFVVSQDADHIVVSGKGSAEAFVYDMDGKLLMSERFDQDLSLNISGLPAGCYLVKIKSINQEVVEVHKIVVE